MVLFDNSHVAMRSSLPVIFSYRAPSNILVHTFNGLSYIRVIAPEVGQGLKTNQLDGCIVAHPTALSDI